jgi:DNA-binding NarL/FixJ family response regulator
MANIIIADDHPFTLIGTKAFVESLGHNVIDLCNNGISAYNSIVSNRPGIAILDMSMPGMNGIELLEKLQQQRLFTKVVLLTMHKEVSIFTHAQKLGVRGYVLKEFATHELENCLIAIQKGDCWFSPELTRMLVMDNTATSKDDKISMLTFTEKKVLELIAKQHTSKEIGSLLFTSEKTVETHRRNIIQKLSLPQEKNALLLWAVNNFGTKK